MNLSYLTDTSRMAHQAITLTENGKLKIEMSEGDGQTFIRPVGVIDEDVNFSAVLDLAEQLGTSRTMVFDLGSIARMNSCGVREWLLFMERIQTKMPIAFSNVNELFIDQANMIPQMLGQKGTPLISFQAPYHCGQCDIASVIMMKPDQVKFNGEQAELPAQKCPKCNSTLELEWMEDEYFSFLRRI